MFILQYNKETGLIPPDVAVIAELIKSQCWLNGEPCNSKFELVDFRDVYEKNFLDDAIPVGGVNFCEAVLGHEMHPLNIPKVLRDKRFTGRSVDVVSRFELLSRLREKGYLFIKSATKCKCSYTGIYTTGENLPEDNLYFISEALPSFFAEWRCFVRNGMLIDIRKYAGSFTESLSKEDISLIKEMMNKMSGDWGDIMPSYVIDVARSDPGRPVIIVEVHNFISCGLYGCENRNLLLMAKDGVRTARLMRSVQL